MVNLKKSVRILIICLFAVAIIETVLIMWIVQMFRPYSISELEYVTVSFVSSHSDSSPKSGISFFYVGNDGTNYMFPDRFFEKTDVDIIGNTLNLYVAESRTLYDAKAVIAWDASDGIPAGSVEEENKELKKSFWIAFVVFVLSGVLFLLLPIIDVCKKICLLKTLQFKKAQRTEEKIARRKKYEEKYNGLADDDISKIRNTKNTSKKKMKQRRK